jgi:hypothetical protein
VDTDTGEFQEKRLTHREDAEKFCRGLGDRNLSCQRQPLLLRKDAATFVPTILGIRVDPDIPSLDRSLLIG